MLVEFVGLPGCGKTTLTAALEKHLRAESYRVQGLRDAAKAAIARTKDKIGFLHHRAERVNLYGASLFAYQHPSLFDCMVRTSRHNLKNLMWNLEALAQMGIVERYGAPDVIVLNDEGFLQRFASNFLDAPDSAELEACSALMPEDFLTISLTVPSEVAHARAKSRRKGIPFALHGDSDAEVLAHFQRYDRVLRWSVAARMTRGYAVLELDATAEPRELIARGMEWLRLHGDHCKEVICM